MTMVRKRERSIIPRFERYHHQRASPALDRGRMIASPTRCNKHLIIFSSLPTTSDLSKPPIPERRRCGCIVYICAGLRHLDAVHVSWSSGTAISTYPPPKTPPNERHMFSFVITASGWRFLFRETPFPHPLRLAGCDPVIPNFFCIVPLVGLGGHPKKQKKRGRGGIWQRADCKSSSYLHYYPFSQANKQTKQNKQNKKQENAFQPLPFPFPPFFLFTSMSRQRRRLHPIRYHRYELSIHQSSN